MVPGWDSPCEPLTAFHHLSIVVPTKEILKSGIYDISIVFQANDILLQIKNLLPADDQAPLSLQNVVRIAWVFHTAEGIRYAEERLAPDHVSYIYKATMGCNTLPVT